ncbi:Acetyl-coenzyme A synthetase [Cucumispora dikerogammari]|nr:Acetyl-coenzyme A synthetase [Cucumispora dikerogammari]
MRTNANEIFKRFPDLNYENDYQGSVTSSDFYNQFTNLLDWYPINDHFNKNSGNTFFKENNTKVQSDTHNNEDVMSNVHNEDSKAQFVCKELDSRHLNACFNCLDRHPPTATLLMYETNMGSLIAFKQQQLMARVQQYAHVLLKYLKYHKIPETDRHTFVVTLYLPMCPDTICIMLACARLGLPHSVVFSGYSKASLITRLIDSKSRLVISTDHYQRGENKVISFLKSLNETLEIMKLKKTELSVLVVEESERLEFEKVGDVVYTAPNDFKLAETHMQSDNEININKKVNNTNIDFFKSADFKDKHNEFIECFQVASSHPLFYLYTSGSTGTPKGLVHTTANYLIYAMLTMKHCFYNPDLFNYNRSNKQNFVQRPINLNKPFFCTADVGWITGHTYCLYGPLALGLCTLICTGLPDYPKGKIFNTLKEADVEVLYTSPTLIRSLKAIYEPISTPIVEDILVSTVFRNEEDKKSFTLDIKTDHVKLNLDKSEILYKGEAEEKTPYNKIEDGVHQSYTSFEDVNSKKAFVTKEQNVRDCCVLVSESDKSEKDVLENTISKYTHTLRLIGSVGEPLNTDARLWIRKLLQTEVVDTYWQTETGGHMLIGIAGNKPMYGVIPKILKPTNDKDGNPVEITKTHQMGSVCFAKPWLGLAKTIIGDHSKYLDTYFKPYPGFYFTGDQGYFVHDSTISTYSDAAGNPINTTDMIETQKDVLIAPSNCDTSCFTPAIDIKSYAHCICYNYIKKNKDLKEIPVFPCMHYSIVITGRTDDVLNISGHRISTQEVEDSLSLMEEISEVAVVSNADDMTGERIVLFVVLPLAVASSSVETPSRMQNNTVFATNLIAKINEKLRNDIGALVRAKDIYFISGLPKTRTGKIMRRTLRAAVRGEDIGDVTTCMNAEVIQEVCGLFTRNSQKKGFS